MAATKNIDQGVPLFTESLAGVADGLSSKEMPQPEKKLGEMAGTEQIANVNALAHNEQHVAPQSAEPSDADVPLLTTSITDIPLTLPPQDVDREPKSATVAQSAPVASAESTKPPDSTKSESADSAESAESTQSVQSKPAESTESQTQADEANIPILATGQPEGAARTSGTARISAFNDIVFTEQQTQPKQLHNRKKPVQTATYQASGEKTWLWIILGVCTLIALGWGYRKITNPTASETNVVFRPILIPSKSKVAIPPVSLKHDETQQVSPFAHFPNESAPTGIDPNANPNSANANNAPNATNANANAQATGEATANPATAALAALPPNTSIIEQNLRLINSIENYHKQLPKPEPVPANLLRK